MSKEELVVMANLIKEVQALHNYVDMLTRASNDSSRKLDEKTKEYNSLCLELNELRAMYDCSNADRKAYRDKAKSMENERDDARLKLGELARFVNFNVYERMNKFVAKGKTLKQQCVSMTNLFEEICESLEKFCKDTNLVLIEEGMAK